MRWGVLSTANIGRAAVIPAIQASLSNVLTSVASRSAERAEAFASKAGIPRAHATYEALLEDSEVDAVYIPLPNSMHLEWVVRAVQAGKHVLCEKPLALTEAECRTMETTAADHGVRLMEAFMYRFHPRTQRVVDRVHAGEIGDIRLIRSSFTFRLTRPDNIRWDSALGGGALMDVGCYCVNVSRTMANAEPIEAQATVNWTERGVDREMVGVLRFPGDVLAHFDCALSLERHEEYEIVGTEGALHVPAAFLPGADAVPIHHDRGKEGGGTEVVPGADHYRAMVEHFSDCVDRGLPFRYTVAEAAMNMRTIEALYRSARSGGRPEAVARD